MGTNYYLRVNECDYCHKSDEIYHIGKSSGGWYFSLHIIPEKGINNLSAWIQFIEDSKGKIYDEYNVEHSLQELLDIIENRSWDNNIKDYDWSKDDYYTSEEDFLDKNNAELGINNLLRYKVDGVHCIGHGSGTWSYIRGEFR